MKNQISSAVATTSLLAAGAASAQNGTMMNGGIWGGTWMDGYGGVWMVVLMIVVVAALVAWIVNQNRK